MVQAILRGDLLTNETKAQLTDFRPIGGPIPGRPWRTTGYGLGLMIGSMDRTGPVAGHSGSGPFSTCAVYVAGDRAGAAFAASRSEATPERAVARVL
ncbi:MAG: hypothetical protein WBA67_08600 [Jannaschia sp.]